MDTRKFGAVLFLCAAVVAGLFVAVSKAPQPEPAPPPVRPDAGLAVKCEGLLMEATQAGAVYRLNRAGSAPELYVAPAFYSMTIDDKRALMGVVSCVLPGGRRGVPADFFLYDSRTGKLAGSFLNGRLRLE